MRVFFSVKYGNAVNFSRVCAGFSSVLFERLVVVPSTWSSISPASVDPRCNGSAAACGSSSKRASKNELFVFFSRERKHQILTFQNDSTSI